MYKMANRVMVLTIIFSLFVCFTAQAEWCEPFGQLFADNFQLTNLAERIVICSTTADDKLYAMTKNGIIYSFDILANQYEIVSRVTPWPSVDFDLPLSMQRDETKKAMADAVTDLFVDEANTLFGFNKMTGTIGTIDADGLHWQSVSLDTSIFFADGDDYPSRVLYQPRIMGNYLEGWVIADMEGEPCITYIFISLNDGKCTAFDIGGAFQLCRLSNHELLALVIKDDQSIALEVYSQTGQYLYQYPVSLPPIRIGRSATAVDLRNILGPLAYDASTNSLYFMDDAHLYKSVAGMPFSIADANVPWMPPLAYSTLQTINEGKVVVNGQWLWK